MNDVKAPATKLTAEEYLAVQGSLRTLAQAALSMISDDELTTFITQAERAQTLGPILDPSAWTKGHRELRVVIEHANALAEFRRRVRKALA